MSLPLPQHKPKTSDFTPTPMHTGMGSQGERGFTLVELLVVISIIGLLSSTVLASLNDARVKARDAVRAQTIGEYKKALYLVYDKYGSYPNSGGGGTVCLGDYPDNACGWFNARPEDATLSSQVDDFLPSLPIIESATITHKSLGIPFLFDGIDYVCTSTSGGQCISARVNWATEKDLDCKGGFAEPLYYNYCYFLFD